MIKWNYFLYRFSYSHLTIRKCKKRKRREREREMIDSYFEWRRKGKKMLEMRKRGKKCTKSGVWWGEARERAHLKIEWSGRNCSRPRAGGREKRIFVARAMASGIRLLNVFIALERTYTQACKRASRTFAFESCATYINWLSFSSIVVRFLPVSFHHRKCSFVLPSRVSFFTFLATNFPTEW